MRKIVSSLLLLLPIFVLAQTNQTKPHTQRKLIAFIHVTVIDTTGAPAKPDMTAVIADHRIIALGKTGKVSVPDGAQVVDARGHYRKSISK
ncbi:MAG TPA: hypothetical protein VGQ81_02275 [Acidobacteriota bacterium]|nr:hypothetical protein [Acidobacteriota bacterium]